jgi:hypothetical protein
MEELLEHRAAQHLVVTEELQVFQIYLQLAAEEGLVMEAA